MKTPVLNKGLVVVLAICCCVMWGSITPVVKVSYDYFQISTGDIPGLTVFAGVRYILCGLVGIAFGSVKNRSLLRPKKSSWGMILKLALVQTFIQQLSFYISMSHISGINGSILGCLNNFFSIFIACLVFHQEKLTARKLLGCALGFLGVVCINLNAGSISTNISLAGEGAMLIACITCGASYAMSKQYSPHEDVLVLMAYQFFLGGIALTLVGLAMGGTFHGTSVAGYALFSYMVVMPITAFTIWGTLLKSSQVSQLSAFGFINPITGVILSALFLKESQQVSPIQCILALALVSVGIVVVNSRGKTQS